MPLKKLNLKMEMAVAVALIFAVIAALSAGLAISRMEAHERRHIIDQQYTLACTIGDSLDSKIRLTRSALQAAAATLPPAAASDRRKLQRYLDDRGTLHSLFPRGLVLFTPDGTLVAKSPQASPLDEARTRRCVLTVASSGQPRLSPPFTEQRSRNTPIVLVAVPVVDQQGIIRFVLGGNLDLLDGNLAGDLQKTRLGKGGAVVLSTRERTILYHTDRARIMQMAAQPGQVPLYDRALSGVDANGETTDAAGVGMVHSFHHLGMGDWTLGISLPAAEAYAGIHQTRRHLVWGFGGGSIAMLVLTWLVMRKLTRPLMDVTQQVRDMQGGELRPVQCAGGNEIGTLAAAFNELVERLNLQQESLQEVMRRQQAIIDNIPDMAWLKDRSGRFITVNSQFTLFSGWTNEMVSGKTDAEIWPPERAEAYGEEDEAVMRTGKRQYTEERVTSRNGETYFMETVRSPIFGAGTAVIGIIGISHDITARKQEELSLRHASTHDRLTGLYNRALFDQELERLSRGRKYPISIIMADVNDLKVVNDTHGHRTGDRLLSVAAQALVAAFRAEDVVARIGGDEFGVIVPEADEEAGREAVKRVVEQLERINRKESDFQVSIAFGIATARRSEEITEALHLSDERMYAHKSAQKAAAAARFAPNPLDYS